jgi:hypothetical protein
VPTRWSSLALLLGVLLGACKPTEGAGVTGPPAPVDGGDLTPPRAIECERHAQCMGGSDTCGFALGIPDCLDARFVIYVDALRKDCARLEDPDGGSQARPLCSLQDVQLRARDRTVLAVRVYPGSYDGRDGVLWYQDKGSFALLGPDPGRGWVELDGRKAIELWGSKDETRLTVAGAFRIKGQQSAVTCDQVTTTRPAKLILRGELDAGDLPISLAIDGGWDLGLLVNGCRVEVYSVLFEGNERGALRVEDGQFLVRKSLFRGNRNVDQTVVVLSGGMMLRDEGGGPFVGNKFVDNSQVPPPPRTGLQPGEAAVNCRSIKVPLEETLFCRSPAGGGSQYGGGCVPSSISVDTPKCAEYEAR